MTAVVDFSVREHVLSPLSATVVGTQEGRKQIPCPQGAYMMEQIVGKGHGHLGRGYK